MDSARVTALERSEAVIASRARANSSSFIVPSRRMQRRSSNVKPCALVRSDLSERRIRTTANHPPTASASSPRMDGRMSVKNAKASAPMTATLPPCATLVPNSSGRNCSARGSMISEFKLRLCRVSTNARVTTRDCEIALQYIRSKAKPDDAGAESSGFANVRRLQSNLAVDVLAIRKLRRVLSSSRALRQSCSTRPRRCRRSSPARGCGR